MRNHDKRIPALPLALLAIMTACPIAAAQDAGQARTTTPPPKQPGAASPSYAACAPGQPIGGIVVKGGQNPKGPNGRAVDACPDSTAKSISEQGVRREAAPAEPEAAARDTRTYTGGRRNEVAPAAAEAALPGQPIKGVIVKGGGPNKPAQAGQVLPGTARSISEKGVSSTKSR